VWPPAASHDRKMVSAVRLTEHSVKSSRSKKRPSTPGPPHLHSRIAVFGIRLTRHADSQRLLPTRNWCRHAAGASPTVTDSPGGRGPFRQTPNEMPPSAVNRGLPATRAVRAMGGWERSMFSRSRTHCSCSLSSATHPDSLVKSRGQRPLRSSQRGRPVGSAARCDHQIVLASPLLLGAIWADLVRGGRATSHEWGADAPTEWCSGHAIDLAASAQSGLVNPTMIITVGLPGRSMIERMGQAATIGHPSHPLVSWAPPPGPRQTCHASARADGSLRCGRARGAAPTIHRRRPARAAAARPAPAAASAPATKVEQRGLAVG